VIVWGIVLSYESWVSKRSRKKEMGIRVSLRKRKRSWLDVMGELGTGLRDTVVEAGCEEEKRGKWLDTA
jgi:hypothetical protein